MKLRFLLLGVLLTLLQAADGFVTQYLVGDGAAREFNPLMAPVAGESWFGFAKITLIVVCLSILFWFASRRTERFQLVNGGLVVVVIFYMFVVGWNVSLLVHYLRI